MSRAKLSWRAGLLSFSSSNNSNKVIVDRLRKAVFNASENKGAFKLVLRFAWTSFAVGPVVALLNPRHVNL